MTHCNLEGPRASTLLRVKWGCGMPTPATQSTDTFKETKYKIKIDSALC